nr:hypothetical protein Iba_chr05cCG13780 [Ipomoea batatas]
MYQRDQSCKHEHDHLPLPTASVSSQDPEGKSLQKMQHLTDYHKQGLPKPQNHPAWHQHNRSLQCHKLQS